MQIPRLARMSNALPLQSAPSLMSKSAPASGGFSP